MAKFAQHLVRSSVYGVVIGAVLSYLFVALQTFVNTVTGTVVLSAGMAGLFGFALGFGASTALELSADIDRTDTAN